MLNIKGKVLPSAREEFGEGFNFDPKSIEDSVSTWSRDYNRPGQSHIRQLIPDPLDGSHVQVMV